MNRQYTPLRHAAVALLLFTALLPVSVRVAAQAPLEPVQGWLATVEPDGRVALTWRAATDSAVAGYCVSTLSDDGRWLQADTLRPRTDTVCHPSGSDPSLGNRYCVHAFDTALTRTSAMTPPFGNMVLNASIGVCDTFVTLSWSRYDSMPGGVGEYRVLGSLDPENEPPAVLLTLSPSILSAILPVSSVTDSLLLWVEAVSRDRELVSASARAAFKRPEAAHPAYLRADTAWYSDSAMAGIVRFLVDPTQPSGYTLMRATRRTPFARLATIPFSPSGTVQYEDRGLSRSDSVYFYLLTATDGCGTTAITSDTLALVMPPPVEPAAYLPNVITPDAEGVNARFCPQMVGLLAEGYALWIYDRMGRLRFHTTNPSECFNGIDSSGRRLPQGSYRYIVHGRFADRSEHTFSGNITILR
ncbi:MAG: gliding motility-associated C-terminal domain-containing protein [Bacteroidales bacterium]|nr:gliding motility-associated C-terminal domain-containing protein [Bacteroidales bacterium]